MKPEYQVVECKGGFRVTGCGYHCGQTPGLRKVYTNEAEAQIFCDQRNKKYIERLELLNKVKVNQRLLSKSAWHKDIIFVIWRRKKGKRELFPRLYGCHDWLYLHLDDIEMYPEMEIVEEDLA